MTEQSSMPHVEHGFTNRIVKIFLESNLALILIVLATVLGLAALGITPREEDPQIVVPLADVYVSFPGHSAAEVEQLVATPLEKILYQIDGVEYVYSMSREDQAIITVRYYVGEDRERSLVKLQKKLDESLDLVPPGVTGWVVKPVEIDDVPIVTLARGQARRPTRSCGASRRRSRSGWRASRMCRGHTSWEGSPGWSRCCSIRTGWRPTTSRPGVAAGDPGGQRTPVGRRLSGSRSAGPRRGRPAVRRPAAVARPGGGRV